MYVSIDHLQGRGREGARLEAHRRYIDIQFTINGHEEIGWKPLGDWSAATAVAFDAARDVTFFSDRPDSWLSLPAGHFAIFFPDDAHAPLAGRGSLKKAIVKIAINQGAVLPVRTTVVVRVMDTTRFCSMVSDAKNNRTITTPSAAAKCAGHGIYLHRVNDLAIIEQRLCRERRQREVVAGVNDRATRHARRMRPRADDSDVGSRVWSLCGTGRLRTGVCLVCTPDPIERVGVNGS